MTFPLGSFAVVEELRLGAVPDTELRRQIERTQQPAVISARPAQISTDSA